MICRFELDSVSAVGAAAVNFQPMPAHPETRPVDGGAKYILNVAVHQIGGPAADGADHVVVVFLMAELVAEFPVFQEDPADLLVFHQEPQAAINRGPPNAREGGAQFLGGKGTPLRGRGADDEATGLGIPIALSHQLGNDLVHHGGGTGCGVVVTGVFDADGNQLMIHIAALTPTGNPVNRLQSLGCPRPGGIAVDWTC